MSDDGIGYMTGLVFALATLLLAGVLGAIWRRSQGRVRTRHATARRGAPAPDHTAAALPDPVLRRVDDSAAVTLLQLSTPICARCPQARAVLGEVSTATDGVHHTELDLAEHPELAGELGVRSTPTTLAISRSGHELFRVTGVPRRAELLSALEAHL